MQARDRLSGDKTVLETNDRLFPVPLGLLPPSLRLGLLLLCFPPARGLKWKSSGGVRFQTDRSTDGRGRRRRFVRRFQKVKINWRVTIHATVVRSPPSLIRFGSGAELERHMSVRCPREFDPQRSFRKWVERIQFR